MYNWFTISDTGHESNFIAQLMILFAQLNITVRFEKIYETSRNQ